MKKIIAILCVAALLAALAGCDPENRSPSYWDQLNEEPTDGDSTGGNELPDGLDEYDLVDGIDYLAAFASYEPDTVMINAGGYAIPWSELFMHMYGYVNYIAQMNAGGPINWLEDIGDGTTVAESVLNYAVENALMYRALEYGAKSNGITLGQEEQNQLQENYQMMLEQYGGEFGLSVALFEYNGCYSLELYNYIAGISMLAGVAFNKLYGEFGESLSDEEVADFTAYGGYLAAKHILRLLNEEGDDAPLKEIEDIKEQLDSYTGDDLEAFFDELMFKYSEDEGLAEFPDGYLFQYSDMVDEFYYATLAIEPGEYSDIVETAYGYHIVFRLPINFDMIPISSYYQEDVQTLRQTAAYGLFDEALLKWKDSIAPVYTPEFHSIDLSAVFEWVAA